MGGKATEPPGSPKRHTCSTLGGGRAEQVWGCRVWFPARIPVATGVPLVERRKRAAGGTFAAAFAAGLPLFPGISAAEAADDSDPPLPRLGCGPELWAAAGAPKERNRIAQGNALGEQDRPAAALTGRNRELLSRPFRAGPVDPAEPRALPWAIPCEPFRLQRQSPCLQFRPASPFCGCLTRLGTRGYNASGGRAHRGGRGAVQLGVHNQ